MLVSDGGSELVVLSKLTYLKMYVSPGGGGLAGDGKNFAKTYVVWDKALYGGVTTALVFYGSSLEVRYASKGGWDPFAPKRLITKSAPGNILYELDNKSALSLYKEYLGKYAAKLPASALLFPLNVRIPTSEKGVVRTILLGS